MLFPFFSAKRRQINVRVVFSSYFAYLFDEVFGDWL